MGAFFDWCKEHKTELIIGAVVGVVGGAVVGAIVTGNNTTSSPTPKFENRFGPDVITKFEDIDEAIFTDLAQEIEDHVMDVNETGKIVIERIYDVTEPYFDGAWGGRFSAGELGDLFAHKVVTVTIEDVIGD